MISIFLGGDIPLDGLRMSLPDKQRGKISIHFLHENDMHIQNAMKKNGDGGTYKKRAFWMLKWV